jgi:uncharacterized protein (TIGR00369 family)
VNRVGVRIMFPSFLSVLCLIAAELQTVHGGLILSLTDTLGSLAVATKGQYMTGVSVDIGTSFVKPGGKAGDVLTAKASVTGMGRLHL